MTDDTSSTSGAEAMTPAGPDMTALQDTWGKRIEEALKERDSGYKPEGERSIRWLRLNKDGRKSKATGDRLNIAYANYEILRTAIYARPPKPVVLPRFGGGPQRQQLDAVAQVIERAIESNNEQTDVHSTLKAVRDDLLRVARGVAWIRYEADFEDQPQPVIDPMTGMARVDASGTVVMAPQPTKTGERVHVEHVGWLDYLEGKAANWKRVPWVARRVPYTKEAFAKRFDTVDETNTRQSMAALAQVKFGDDTKKDQAGAGVYVWEIWCRESRKVYFFVENASRMLEVSEPLIDFSGFFPCPEPAMSVFEDGTRTPIPEVLLIEDQLVEIDALTKRINALREALKVRGFYSKGATATTAAGAIERAVKSTDDRELLIPVEAWAANGKWDLGVVWLPIDVVVQVIRECTNMRKEAIDLVYQVTGISDVMRGASEASETLGAQQIKAQWGSVRVRDKQGEMVRVARDVCRMVAEVICELFDPETISQLAVYGFEPPMLELMRADRMRSMYLEIETDSTIQSDEDAEKARRIEFATAIGGMVQNLMPVMQAAPELLPMAGELMKFVTGGFRAGREMEKTIDAALQALQARISQPQQPAPDPTQQAKTEAELAKADATKVKAQADVAKAQIDLQAAAVAPLPGNLGGGLVQ